MKKIFICFLFLFSTMISFACGKKSVPKKMSLGGVEYDSKFVLSGYYFDKASFSNATLASMMEKIEVIEKPEYLGEVKLPDFSAVELINNKTEEITDQMIEAEIEKERDSEVSYSPVKTKREAKMTDKVIIDFKGFMDGVAFDGGEATDYELILGSSAFIPGFEEKVAGHRAGSKFSIDLTFPEDYVENLAGKDVTFEITIKSIQEANTPEVNEEFVKKHTEKNSITVDDYKNEIRERIENRNEFLNSQNLRYQLYEKLMQETICDPTEEALAWQFSVYMNQMISQAAQSGMTLSSIFDSNGITANEAFEEIKSAIPEYIVNTMAIDAIMEKYDMKLTENEVKDWFNTMSSLFGYGAEMNYDDVKKNYGYDYLLYSAKQDKAIESAIKECKLIEPKEEENESVD